ncbi:MAG TPA: c-type cytochrome [Flavobacteriia bacterium]|nr:c-type cytochrome [Flavobacteriia bacterium]
MKTKINVGFGLLLTIIIFLVVGFKSKPVEIQYQKITEKNSKSDLKITGNDLFQKNCATCHGTNRKGNPPTFPSLVNIKEKMTKGQIGTLLKTGRNIMPNFSHLSDSERNAIVGFLYGESTTATEITEVTAVERGKSLFVANCMRCHKVSPKDNTPTDQLSWGMKPPILGGISARVNKQSFNQILNMGPCYMPSFADMKNKDKEAIYAYLSSFKNPYQNYNHRMRRGCGMMSR